MESKLNWDELKLVLAIARAGSLAGAARQLGVSHATVFRHLNSVEKTLGVSLFQRATHRYTATGAGDALVATAADVETQVLAVEQRLTGHEVKLSGTIRLTTTDTLLSGLLAPILSAFQAEYPAISLEVSVSNAVFSLARRDADIAIRPGQKPNEHLVGRRIGVISQAVYAALDHDGVDDIHADQHWIGTGTDIIYPELETWMQKQGLEPRCRMFTNSLLATCAAVAAGSGIAVLPCYLGDADTRLRRVGESVPELASDLWLLVHPELKRIAPIKAFNDYVFAATREQLLQPSSC
jgi:molybdate transport repressor ModE-like protein